MRDDESFEKYADRLDAYFGSAESLEIARSMHPPVDFVAEGNRYIDRGLVYLMFWFLIAPILFAAIGWTMLGFIGLILGIVASIGLGAWGYDAFLKWNYRKLIRRNARG